jgi:hypothetical protein
MPKSTQLLNTWNADAQQRWREHHTDMAMVFHLLLDASGSMAPYEEALRRAYNLYLDYLQRHAHPMSLIGTHTFGLTLERGETVTLGAAPPLTPATYHARLGGTALYDAIGTLANMVHVPMQHILIVMTDGADMDSTTYTASMVAEVLTTLQAHAGWLCVYLGAYEDALASARAMGFNPGNCVTFACEHLPEAFARLTHATQRYLQASPAHRKLLAAGHFFEQVTGQEMSDAPTPS